MVILLLKICWHDFFWQVVAILIFCVSNLTNHRYYTGEENKLLPNLCNNMDPNEYLSGHNLKNTGRKRKFGYTRKYAIWMDNFYFKYCSLRNS